jgi:DNA replication protein DnaD
MQGWIKLHRQITDNEFYGCERFDKTHAWIDLLLLAGHTKQTIFIRNVEINLKPGDLCYSQQSLGKRWKWNRKTVRRYLNLLKNRNMVDVKISKVTSIVSILNWEKFQNAGQLNGQQDGQLMDIRTDTNKNDKNVNNEKNDNVGARFIEPVTRQESFNPCRNFFISYVKSKINPDYVFDSREGKHLKDILKKITAMVKSNGQVVTDSNVEETFRYIITNITDKWLLERFTLSKINSQFNETIQSIKTQNGTDIDRTFDELAAELYEGRM